MQYLRIDEINSYINSRACPLNIKFTRMFCTYVVLVSLCLMVNVTNAKLKNDVQEDDLRRQQEILVNSGQFEGDILSPMGRNGLKNKSLRWPNKIVPYELDSSYTKAQARIIHQAVQEINKRTCVKVIPKRRFDKDYIYVNGSDKRKCYSHVGREGGIQVMNLCPLVCLHPKIIVHEFLHAIGFYHEQSNIVRDDYLKILWDNIRTSNFHNFEKHDTTSFGLPYDYESIMHYHETAFSKNGKPTMVPIDRKWIGRVGKSVTMTLIDVAKVNAMYGCKK